MDALFLRRLDGIEGVFRACGFRVTLPSFKFLKIIGTIPLAAPLPDVARHVVETVVIWGNDFTGAIPALSLGDERGEGVHPLLADHSRALLARYLYLCAFAGFTESARYGFESR